MSASPVSTPVTTPDEETVATAGLDDCQVAWLVTFWVVPFERFAVAVKGDEAPTAGVVPPIVIDFGVPVDALGVEVETSPQAHIASAIRKAAAVAPSRCRISDAKLRLCAGCLLFAAA